MVQERNQEDEMKVIKRSKTRKYDMFTMAKGNREYSESHVKRLARSIQEKNMLEINPIICAVDRGRLVVYDGQHRLAAAKMLNVDIFYIVVDGLTPGDIARINKDQKGWLPKDFIQHYAGLGHAHYIRLMEFMGYHKLPPSMAIQLLSGYICEGGCGVMSAVRSGDFRIKGEVRATEILDILNAIAGAGCKFTRDRSFVKAIAALYKTKIFNVSRLVPRLKYMPLEKAANWIQYVEQIDARYNYRAKPCDKVALSFEATRNEPSAEAA